MSYDLMVFNPARAPKNKAEFMKWYEQLTKWGEGHSYDDVSICPPELQSWYREMLTFFPAMNGPDAVSDEELDEDEDTESRVSDYCVAKDAIYVAFAWSQAENAYDKVAELARKHQVGFFDVSGKDLEIILPGGGPVYTMRTNKKAYTNAELQKLGSAVFRTHLEQFTPKHWDFIVLEASEPIDRCTFIQVGAPDKKTDFKMTVEIGMDNPDKTEMYRCYSGSQQEVFDILSNYFERQQIPDISGWQDVSDEMN